MDEIRHRSKGPAKTRLPRPLNAEALLSLAVAQPIIKRIAANVDPDYLLRADHIARVAAVCVRAKFKPTNPYARATLPATTERRAT